jgi:hypothetical protein
MRLRNQILVHMPYEKHTVRHQKIIRVEHDVKLMEKVVKTRWNPYEERPIRDVTELLAVLRKVANTDTSRLRALRERLSHHNRLVVFYNFNYELEALRGLKDDMTVAEWNGHKHDDVPETDRWVYLVQYAAGSEGWNCTDTDAMLFYSLTYSYKNWEQAHGRIDRMNSPFMDLWYYVLRSNSVIDMAIWRSLKAKQSFQPRSFDERKL